MIRTRLLKKNKNYIVIITGEPGSGKSYAGLDLCEMVDPEFTIDKVVFDVKKFVEQLKPGTLKKGGAIMFDELGVRGGGSRDFFSIQNKMLNYLLQVVRSDNQMIVFTVPSLQFIDTNIKKLMHGLIRPVHIDTKRRVCFCKVFQIQNDDRSKKVYYKYYRFTNPNGRRLKHTLVGFKNPSRKLRTQYEKMKLDFNDSLKADVVQSLTDGINVVAGAKKKEKGVQQILPMNSAEKLQDIANSIIKQKDKYVITTGSRRSIDKLSVMLDYGIPHREAEVVWSYVKRTFIHKSPT